MPGGGVTATRGILARSPHTRVVAFSGRDDRATVLEMIAAGAAGYLVKGAGADDILETIVRTARGEASPATETSAAVILDAAARVREHEAALHEQLETRRRIAGVLDEGSFSVVLQPIADLRTGRVMGAEALARFPGDPARSSDSWFRDGMAVGLTTRLELACLRRALDHFDDLPDDVLLSVNVSPDTIVAVDLKREIRDAPQHRLMLEITEHARVDDYDALRPALAELREQGVRFAIDDAGAGFASLRHILMLAPDAIKLDVDLVRHVDTDLPRRALAKSLITFAEETSTAIIAEGIETPAELQALLELGASYGQGFHLARPTPPPLAATRVRARA